uniref:Cation channel sperm-associated auxiliary subunit delta n=1 Tax=Pogona vitticeps TaxID=103695 RepID=A0A6J0THU5_9SAUR
MIQNTALWKSCSLTILLVKCVLSLARFNGEWPCSEERLVYSSYAYHSKIKGYGINLSYKHNNPVLLYHPCTADYFEEKNPPAIYLGKKVFLSLDGFESSLLPLTISNYYVTSPAIVSAVVFVENSRILLVINEKVFLFLYSTLEGFKKSKGIDRPVTEITNIDCCFSAEDPVCRRVGNTIIAYKPEDPTDYSNIFFSKDGGYSFSRISNTPSSSTAIRAYNFISLSQIAVFTNATVGYRESSYFIYGGALYMNNRKGSLFCLEPCENETIISLIPPGLRGFIILWTNNSLLFSFNNGLTVEPITVHPTEKYGNKSFLLHGKGFCNVAVRTNEIAAITNDLKLFYGSLDMVSTKMVHIGDADTNATDEFCDALTFVSTGMILLFHPVRSNESEYYNFEKCTINIQDTLMTLQPPLQPCPVEILSGDFHNKMYYLDMKQQLHFNVTFVPKAGTGAHPYVTVSNPHVLAFQAHIVEDGYTYNGNTRYSMKIRLLQQQFSNMARPEFQEDIYIGRLSTITVDIYNKGIFCIDMHPLTALIAVDCPPKKHIRIVKTTTACSKGLFKNVVLQNNFSYSVNHNVYDPTFHGRQHLSQEDLNVTYRYDLWGCPLLLYYDSPWLPLLELWDNDEFVEYVSADFVLFEINGMHNYDYLLTEVEANCVSQAQNWTTLLNYPEAEPHNAWSRYNYQSCKEPRGNESLPSASSIYQVLNKNEKNRILFQQYNGIYVFKVIVVDALYSYCELTTVFSVYVHGALPKSEINAGKTLVSFLVLIFGTILMVYYFPKLLKENARMKSIWT